MIAFAGSAGLCWLYFDNSAEAGEEAIARSADPGRLGRSAYHFLHPVMVAGIITVAAADQIVVGDATAPARAATSWLILGGAALYIAGHAAFKAVVWHRISWPRVGALVALALLGVLAPHVDVLVLAACAAGVILGVALADYLERGRRPAASGEINPAAGGQGAGDPGAGEPEAGGPVPEGPQNRSGRVDEYTTCRRQTSLRSADRHARSPRSPVRGARPGHGHTAAAWRYLGRQTRQVDRAGPGPSYGRGLR